MTAECITTTTECVLSHQPVLRPKHNCHNRRLGSAAPDKGQIMRFSLASALTLLVTTTAHAQTVYPIDRAEILAGARFDFKVEFADRLMPDQAKVTVNGVDVATAFGKA